MRIPNHVWQIRCTVRFKLSDASALLRGVLLRSGFKPEDLVETIEQGVARFEIFRAKKVDAVKVIAKEYGLPVSDVYRESLSLTEEDRAD